MDERDARRREAGAEPSTPPRLRRDPAAPHTTPHPSHVPRWLAWLLLAAFAASGMVCVELALR